MKESDVILTTVPQADGELKERPAIFLRETPPYRDLLVCGISIQLHRYVKDFDEIISPVDEQQGGHRPPKSMQEVKLFAEVENISRLRSALAIIKSRMPFEVEGAVVLLDHMHFLSLSNLTLSTYRGRKKR